MKYFRGGFAGGLYGLTLVSVVAAVVSAFALNIQSSAVARTQIAD